MALQFEDNSRNTSILDKTGELNSSKDLSKDALLDSRRIITAPVNPRSSTANESSNRETRNATTDLSSSSLMMSFSNDNQDLIANRNLNSEKSGLDRLETEQQSSINSQGPLAEKLKSEGKEKKRELSDAPTHEEKKMEDKPATKNLGEKADQLDETSGPSQKNKDSNTKNEDLRKMLFDLSEENTRLKSELSNLKSSTFKEKPLKKGGSLDANVYQLWYVLVVAIIAMILGAFLSTN